jgi:SET domain-containing protein
MNKLIDHLKNDVYCRLGVSTINGVGVFAIKDIPQGIDPFKNLSNKKDKIITVYDNDLKEIDSNVIKLVKDFFGNNGTYDILYDGPNYINISYYLNHSTKPNINTIQSVDDEYYKFITNTFIKKGKELTINYNDYN